MSSSWRQLDSTIAQTPMPPEYANVDMRVSVQSVIFMNNFNKKTIYLDKKACTHQIQLSSRRKTLSSCTVEEIIMAMYILFVFTKMLYWHCFWYLEHARA